MIKEIEKNIQIFPYLGEYIWCFIFDKNKLISLLDCDVDSFNKKVINLTTNEILYQNDEERMYKHYLNAFKDYEINDNNKELSINLIYQILRGA